MVAIYLPSFLYSLLAMFAFFLYSMVAAQFEPLEIKKYHPVTTCSCTRSFCYTTGILVKIMHLSQLFFHMLTLKALTKLNVSMKQYH